MSDLHHNFLPSPKFSEFGPEIERELAAYALNLDQGQELNSLMDALMAKIFESCRLSIGADSGAIWLADAGRTRLAMSYNPAEPQLLNLELPLGSGLISLVLAAEQGICEQRVWEKPGHNKLVDQKVGRVTSAMVATPLYVCGQTRGVISFIKWKPEDGEGAPEFEASHLLQVQQMAVELERLLNYKFFQILFDLDRGQL